MRPQWWWLHPYGMQWFLIALLFSTERCIPNGMQISNDCHAVTADGDYIASSDICFKYLTESTYLLSFL